MTILGIRCARIVSIVSINRSGDTPRLVVARWRTRYTGRAIHWRTRYYQIFGRSGRYFVSEKKCVGEFSFFTLRYWLEQCRGVLNGEMCMMSRVWRNATADQLRHLGGVEGDWPDVREVLAAQPEYMTWVAPHRSSAEWVISDKVHAAFLSG